MTDPLVNVRPITITDAMLISSDVTEADYTAWSSGTTYALADRSIVTTGVHKIYESLQAANLNHAVTDTAWWIPVSPTNRWKCFDTSNSTQTAKATSAQYVLRPLLNLSHLAILNNTDVVSVRAQMVSDAYGAVYDNTIYLTHIIASPSWYEWFLGVKQSISADFMDDLPTYPDSTITIDITGRTTMAFGVLMLGQGQEIGQGVQTGARKGIQDYSRKETNDFGDTVFVQRAYARRASFNMRLLESEIDIVDDFLSRVRAVPCLWIGVRALTCTFVFGAYEDFEISINYGDLSACSINLLGLT